MKMTLYNNGRGYFDEKVYTICDEPLEIEIESEENIPLYAVCTIGNERSVIKVRDGKLTIPPSFLAPGILLFSIQQVKNGEVVKRWRAERLMLRRLTDKYEVIPELVLLQDEIATTKKALKELFRLVKKNNQI